MPEEFIQGGYYANKHGKLLEYDIIDGLIRRGYQQLTKEEKNYFVKADGLMPPPSEWGDKWFVPQVRLERNLYLAKYTTDVFVYNEQNFPEGFHLEVKWQSSSGSVDEKYVFTVLSLQQFKADTILILDGGGARQGAISWIKSMSGKKGFQYFNLIDFKRWANKYL